MTKQPSIEKTMAPLDDTTIIIIGPRSLQNGLMGHFLEEKTGAKCLVIADPSQIPAMGDEEGSDPRVILGDCLEKDLDSCMADLESCGEPVLSRDCVVLFNVSPGLKIEENALRRGVKGFFYEQDPLEVFPRGLAAILKGEIWVSRDIMTKFIPDDKGPASSRMEASILTPREIEILSLVAVGAKNEEIAEKLYISSNTVKTHIYNIFKKIDVPNRLQAALWAAKNL
jgi:LuxR family transcriptional regulator of csgAB operon